MDNGKRHDGEVDTFEPVAARSGPDSSVEHIETETNVFSVDALRRAAAQHGGTDTGSFEVSTPKSAAGGADFDPPASKPSGAGNDGGEAADFEPPPPKRPVIDTADDDPLDDLDDPLDDIDDPLDDVGDPLDDDDFPQKKGGFFANLFRRFSGRSNEDDDLDDLSLDDDMFIAPPPVSGRTAPAPISDVGQPPVAVAATVTDSGVFELGPSTAESVSETIDEPASVATATEVTDSGVFELGPSTDESVSETVVEPASVATATEVTDSGVFELGPSTEESISKAVDEPASVATTTEVTDSGVFELGPSTDESVSKTIDEPASVATATEVTDSGVFELGPSAGGEAVSAVGGDSAPINTTVTDSGIFELSPAAAPLHPQGAQKGGDEWEIGWEPEDDGAAAEPSADAAAATEAPPPVFTKFAHVCLYVKDLGRSVEFYNKLGFQKRFAFNRNGSLFGAFLEFGTGNFIELFEDVSRSATASLGRLAHFCLETPDIDAAMESLSARGIGFSPKKLGCDSTYQIWLKDPDGNEFEIHQYTEKSSQIVGGEVEADW